MAMRLKTYLVSLTLATLLPVALFAGIVGYLLVQEQRETFRRGAEERTLAVLTAIDNELEISISTLNALATLPSLGTGNLVEFRDRAERILAAQPQWANINLALPSGQQVMNLQVPPGAPLPDIGELDGSFARLRESAKPVVSDLAFGPVLKRWSFAVRVPVVRAGQLKYVLSAEVKADSLNAVIRAQRLPENWFGVVIDHNGRIVARSFDPERTQGLMASQSLRDGLARSASGWFRGFTIEGNEVYTPYRRSDISGWAFAMGIPATAVDGAAWRAAGLLTLALLVAVVLAFALAHFVGRRIAAPIASLASATTAIRQGARPQMPRDVRIAEVASLANTLQDTLLALHEREERLQLALKAGRMGNWEWDVRANKVTWSDELEAIHGLPAGTFPGTFDAYEKDIHPDDREHVRQTIARSFEQAEHHVEYRIVRPDGAIRWVEGRGKVFRDDSGAPTRVVGVCTDITERKKAEEELRQAEERMRSVVDHVLDGIITIDEGGVVQTFNPGAERIFGYEASEVIGQNVKMLMPAPYRDEHDRYVANYMQTGEAKIIGIGREVEGRRKDGSCFPLDLAVSTFHVGSRGYFTGLVRDITERKRIEEALRRADRAKDEFLAMVSHELRNPLAGLAAASYVLGRAEPSSDEARKARGVVERQTKQMSHLVGDLLDISRVTLGKLTLHRTRFDAADVVSGMVDVWRVSGRLDEHRVSLSVRPAWVEADRTRLEQMAANLLDNALKFTPKGEAVAITVQREGGEMVLRVADKGIGLQPEECEKVFELFMQGDESENAHAGLGIGLALVRRLAELHGGSASAFSEGRGCGAVFTIRIPAVEPATREAEATSLRPNTVHSTLILEGDDDARRT